MDTEYFGDNGRSGNLEGKDNFLHAYKSVQNSKDKEDSLVSSSRSTDCALYINYIC
jgi:hypothetical protein